MRKIIYAVNKPNIIPAITSFGLCLVSFVLIIVSLITIRDNTKVMTNKEVMPCSRNTDNVSADTTAE